MRYIIRLNDAHGTFYRRATSTGQGGWIQDKAHATRYDAPEVQEYLSSAHFIGLGVGEAVAVIRVA